MLYRLEELAKKVGGRIVGGDASPGETPIRGISGISDAREGDLTFLTNLKYAPWLAKTKASAVLMGEQMDVACGAPPPIPVLKVKNADAALVQVAGLFQGERLEVKPGIHPTAVVAKEAKLGKDVYVGPHVVVEKGAEIGDKTAVHAGTYIGAYVKIGAVCILYPRVVLWERVELGNRVVVHSGAVIGMEGFRYFEQQGVHQAIPQMGRVVIEDDVRVGANVTIDRARFDKTWIKKGTKLDNLIQIGHNVVIGENCLMAAQCGIAGSVRIGNNVRLGGQAAIKEHLEIGDNVAITAKSLVAKNVPSGQIYSGYFARPHAKVLREHAALQKLPEMVEELKNLKKLVQEKL